MKEAQENPLSEKEQREAEIAADELAELEQKLNEPQGQQLRIDTASGELHLFDELKSLLVTKMHDPATSYSIYYAGLTAVLRRYLPAGKSNLELRQLIYDEKNVFLTQGKKKSDNNGRRGADGRMQFTDGMWEIFDVVTDWAKNSLISFELYTRLYQLNDKYGYGHEQYDKTSTMYAMAQKMNSGGKP